MASPLVGVVGGVAPRVRLQWRWTARRLVGWLVPPWLAGVMWSMWMGGVRGWPQRGQGLPWSRVMMRWRMAFQPGRWVAVLLGLGVSAW